MFNIYVKLLQYYRSIVPKFVSQYMYLSDEGIFHKSNSTYVSKVEGSNQTIQTPLVTGLATKMMTIVSISVGSNHVKQPNIIKLGAHFIFCVHYYSYFSSKNLTLKYYAKKASISLTRLMCKKDLHAYLENPERTECLEEGMFV